MAGGCRAETNSIRLWGLGVKMALVVPCVCDRRTGPSVWVRAACMYISLVVVQWSSGVCSVVGAGAHSGVWGQQQASMCT